MAGKPSKRAVTHERHEPDDRVVPPVMRFAEMPEVNAGGEQGPVDAGRELLNPRVKRVAPGGAWRALDDARVRIRFDETDQRGQALPAHHAVGIEHDHVAVASSPAATEVADVAALALDAMLTPTVVHAPEAIDRTAHVRPSGEFRNAGVRLAAVR